MSARDAIRDEQDGVKVLHIVQAFKPARVDSWSERVIGRAIGISQERATAAFDPVKVGIHLVSAVNRQVNHGMLVQRGQWDAQPLRIFFDLERAGHAQDVL